MNSSWGVYGLQGKAADGTHVAANDRAAVRWFVRWRVNGNEHKRTLNQKGHAKTFRELLTRAQTLGLDADGRGFPLDAHTISGTRHHHRAQVPPSRSFKEYCLDVWWPTIDSQLGDRNRAGHRKNMTDAIEWLRYTPGDPRLNQKPGADLGASIRMDELNSDDVKQALVRRRNHNDRVAAANARRIAAAATMDGAIDLELPPTVASDRTVNAFWITLGMIVRSAAASHQADRSCLEGGASALAPRPKQTPVSRRLVPSIQEVFDLADCIASLGPAMGAGRHMGDRFRALVLVGGTLGPRPGELVAHRPDWITREDGLTYVVFEETETPFYDRRAGVRGRTVNPLKHRPAGEFRAVPALADVVGALETHHDRGYGSADRTFTSPTGSAHLTWGNITTRYWRPACQSVFGGGPKAALANMPPKTLRKAAITFWLDSGVSLAQAAEWAGHSEEVAQRHYAGRVSPSYAREAAMLASGAAGVRNVDRIA